MDVTFLAPATWQTSGLLQTCSAASSSAREDCTRHEVNLLLG